MDRIRQRRRAGNIDRCRRGTLASGHGVDRESGLLGFTMLLGARGPYLVQYWSSLDKLYAYASAPDQEHRPAWTRFNKRARKAPGAVGIWHETHLVERAESIYVATPPMGLPRVTETVPIASRHDRARARLADGGTRSSAGRGGTDGPVRRSGAAP
ncbi:monooxygenase family protein [Microbacterium enclense]|uniref:monooxygenase family protein n=1 Tax=Microbacterium enclense TaxID=993073 RepID=UPI003F7D2983